MSFGYEQFFGIATIEQDSACHRPEELLPPGVVGQNALSVMSASSGGLYQLIGRLRREVQNFPEWPHIPQRIFATEWAKGQTAD